ncbi:MAG: hypothetical protein H0T79_12720 [Deltaproteobacteria bacterium]|nr:hypothetical protein [Deltaproteobacteria bacterium]
MHDIRRHSPRIDVEALCWWEAPDGRESSAIAVDLSSRGLRIERPYLGGGSGRGSARGHDSVPLQLEVPGIDEIMWARGDSCFDQLVPTRGAGGGPLGFVRRTGYRIVVAAARDLRRLEEYVFETHRSKLADDHEVALASCYARM